MTTETTNATTSHSKLHEFFLEELKDIYWAEKKLAKTLPTMEEAATTQQLRNAFATHLQQTNNHISRLEQVFSLLGQTPEAKKCHAMAGIVDEGEEIIDDTEEGTAQRDVGLIFAAQKVEHYEIATYGGLATLATVLGLTKAKELLGQTLAEEKETDALLTQIAESGINYKAGQEQES